MAEYIKECVECHREFVARKASAKYCSGKCRKRAFDRTHNPPRKINVLREGGEAPPPETRPPSVTLDEISVAVQSVKYSIATLSAGSLTAKHEYREFCKGMAHDLDSVIRKYLPNEGTVNDA